MKVLCVFCGANFHSATKETECNSCGMTDIDNFIFSENEKPIIPESQMMYLVSYNYLGREETAEVTEKRLTYMREYSKKYPEYFADLKIVKELGMTDTTWLAKWYEIGINNHWIAGAWDPQFTIGSFSECKTLEYLITKLQGGGWCLGQAFYYKNLCFIQQVNGGDEWMVIKEDKDFESYSCGAVLRRDKFKFIKDIYRYLNTPTSQIQTWDYVDVPDVIEIDGIVYREEVGV